MRYPTGDLAILSAESYDDGRKHRRSTGKTRIKSTVAGVVTQDSGDGPSRKRRKTSSPDAAGEEEEGEKKRTRGRPRLEPKDETAQDVSRPVCSSSCLTYVIDHGMPARSALQYDLLRQCLETAV